MVTWPGAPSATLERAGVAFRTTEDLLGPEGLAAVGAAGRAWARVWGRLPLVDGRSFRELVEWRGHSLLWSAEAFLQTDSAGPVCARAAELALRLLEATAPLELDAFGLPTAEERLLGRAATARGVLFHGTVAAVPRPLPVTRRPIGRGLLRAAIDTIRWATRRRLCPAFGAGSTDAAPVVAFLAGDDELRAVTALVPTLAAELGRAVLPVSPETLRACAGRRARRAAREAESLLQERLRALRGTPGLTASYAHRGVAFADLAAGDIEALLLHRLPTAARHLEAAIELLEATRAGAALIVVPERDLRRTLVHAAVASGLPAVVMRLAPPDAADAFRADGGPQPAAVLEWEAGAEPSAAVARLGDVVRGRVESG